MTVEVRDALSATAILVALGIAVTTIEWLARRSLWGDDHLASWEVARTRHHLLSVGRLASVLHFALRPGVFVFVSISRLVFVGLAVAPYVPIRLRAALWLLTFAILALGTLRSGYGQDGSDQMFMLESLALGATLLVGTETAMLLGVYFIAVHLAFCYLVAGSSKLVSSTWRSGKALPLIFQTRAYGDENVRKWLCRHQSLALLGSWSVMLLEITFPFVFVAPAVGLVVRAKRDRLFATERAKICRCSLRSPTTQASDA